MEVTDDRGIECKGLCFALHHGEISVSAHHGGISVSAYRDHPGVRRDLNEPYFHKHFTIEEWKEISDYLMQMHDRGDGPELVEDEDEEKDEPEKVEEVTTSVLSGGETERQKLDREREEKAKLEQEDAEAK